MPRPISSGSPLLPMAEAGEVAGAGPQVVEAGVLLGGAGPGPGLAGHVGGESRADHRSARRRFEYRLRKIEKVGRTKDLQKCIDLNQTSV